MAFFDFLQGIGGQGGGLNFTGMFDQFFNKPNANPAGNNVFNLPSVLGQGTAGINPHAEGSLTNSDLMNQLPPGLLGGPAAANTPFTNVGRTASGPLPGLGGQPFKPVGFLGMMADGFKNAQEGGSLDKLLMAAKKKEKEKEGSQRPSLISPPASQNRQVRVSAPRSREREGRPSRKGLRGLL